MGCEQSNEDYIDSVGPENPKDQRKNKKKNKKINGRLLSGE